MAHLIQPIEIDGTEYCLTCQGNLVTKGVATDIFNNVGPNGAIITTDCGGWQLAKVFAGPGLNGEISFGATCLSTVTIKLTSNGSGGSGSDDYSTYINGVLVGANSGSLAEDGTSTEVVSLVDSPCGSVITVIILNQGSATTVDLEITGVT